MSEIKGLELLHNLFKEDLASPEDGMVLILHCLFLNYGNLCVGIGDEWPPESEEIGSEILPKKWNENKQLYTLRYISDKKEKFLAKITPVNDNLILTILETNKVITTANCFKVSQYVADEIKDFRSTYKNLDDVRDIFEKAMNVLKENKKNLDKEVKPKPKEVDESGANDDDVLFIKEVKNQRPFLYNTPPPFPFVGRGDMGPFGHDDERGMLLFPPSRPHVQPFADPSYSRGMVPPGARFFHINPMGSNFDGPDPDHLPPPGSSDMFM